MCTEALVIAPDGQESYCETVGQLAKALGVHQRKVSDDPHHCCLCNAHWEVLGARKASNREGFPHPEYIIDMQAGRGGG